MVTMHGHIQLMITGNTRSYLCYYKLSLNICNHEVHEEKWTESLKSCHFPINSSSICTHEDNLFIHSGCLWCSSSSWSTCPPPRCLHPPTAAEKLHAFISLRRCSQAVTGKWHLTSPTQPTTQAFKKPPRSFPQHCPRQHYTGSLRAALPAPLWPNGLWSSEGREGGEAEYLSPLSAFSLLCTSALPYFWFDFCTLWSECSECLVPPSS